MLGKWRKTYGDSLVKDTIQACKATDSSESVSEPEAWITEGLKARSAGSVEERTCFTAMKRAINNQDTATYDRIRDLTAEKRWDDADRAGSEYLGYAT